MREAAGFSETTVHIYQTAWHHFLEEQLSSKSSHLPDLTNVNHIKNAVFWDVTPCNQMCTEISERSAAYKMCSVEGGSGMLLKVDTSLLPR
jgi:hypothetical protein